MNAQQYITAALRKLRVKRRGFDLSSEDTDQGLEALNTMLQHWSIDDLVIPYRTRETLTLTSGTNPHTIGSAGTLNTVQPTDIVAATIRSSDSDFELGIRTVQEYERIGVKTTTGRPDWLYFERGLTLGSIFFDLVPDANYTFILNSLKPLGTFSVITSDDTFPAEYDRVIIFNLAVELASEYGKEPPPTVQRIAIDSYYTLTANNAAARVPILQIDPALLRTTPFHINEIS